MKYAFDRFQIEIKQVLLNTGLIEPEELDLAVPKAANVQADLALACFRAAHRRASHPAQYATLLAKDARALLESGSLIGGVEAVGPYVNFELNAPVFARQVLSEVAQGGDGYGGDDLGAGQAVVVDYSSPNIAKRMHVGHIRSTIIGQALVNLLRALGYTVVGDNHLGDWGKQLGVLMAAVARHGMPDGDGEEVLERFEQLYAEFAQQTLHDALLSAEANRWSLSLEKGDAAARDVWRRSVELTRRANQRNYDRLGVRFNVELGESFYAPMTQAVIDEALARRVAYRDTGGALVVDVEGLPTFLLQRSDGGTLYHTRDLAAIRYRQETYHPARIVYVVGKPQELHFQQLFAVARKMGYAPPELDLVHVKFGTIFGPDGQPLSTRRGNMTYLETLLGEAVRRARTVVDGKTAERDADLSPEERAQIAEAIGVGAVIYNDLYQDPGRNISLDWDRMLSLDGNSATYLQYTHTRCRSILQRAQEVPATCDAAQLRHPSERALVKALGDLPLKVREAGSRFAPFLLAEWLYDTARAFSAFYHDCPVLDAPTAGLRAARLNLVSATARCLKNGLALLGIQAPERM